MSRAARKHTFVEVAKKRIPEPPTGTAVCAVQDRPNIEKADLPINTGQQQHTRRHKRQLTPEHAPNTEEGSVLTPRHTQNIHRVHVK